MTIRRSSPPRRTARRHSRRGLAPRRSRRHEDGGQLLCGNGALPLSAVRNIQPTRRAAPFDDDAPPAGPQDAAPPHAIARRRREASACAAHRAVTTTSKLAVVVRPRARRHRSGLDERALLLDRCRVRPRGPRFASIDRARAPGQPCLDREGRDHRGSRIRPTSTRSPSLTPTIVTLSGSSVASLEDS